jgi:hypothetical protein
MSVGTPLAYGNDLVVVLLLVQCLNHELMPHGDTVDVPGHDCERVASSFRGQEEVRC